MQIRILPGGRFSENSTVNILVNGFRKDFPIGQVVTVSDVELDLIRATGASYTTGDAVLPIPNLEGEIDALGDIITALAARVSVVDAQVKVEAGNPTWRVDGTPGSPTDSGIVFVRASRFFLFYIDGVAVASLSAAGNLLIKGTLSPGSNLSMG